jgi:uncharacterized protein (DUF2141 family)
VAVKNFNLWSPCHPNLAANRSDIPDQDQEQYRWSHFDQRKWYGVVTAMARFIAAFAAAAALAMTGSASAGSVISNDMSRCSAGQGPAVKVVVQGVKSSTGKIRVQSYPATKAAWLTKGRWLQRIESGARAGTMNFCLPVSSAGNYAVAVRHDKNGNGSTDISSDGGGFSNNPSINVLNLGKPSVGKVSFYVGSGVTTVTINMKYM